MYNRRQYDSYNKDLKEKSSTKACTGHQVVRSKCDNHKRQIQGLEGNLKSSENILDVRGEANVVLVHSPSQTTKPSPTKEETEEAWRHRPSVLLKRDQERLERLRTMFGSKRNANYNEIHGTLDQLPKLVSMSSTSEPIALYGDTCNTEEPSDVLISKSQRSLGFVSSNSLTLKSSGSLSTSSTLDTSAKNVLQGLKHETVLLSDTSEIPNVASKTTNNELQNSVATLSNSVTNIAIKEEMYCSSLQSYSLDAQQVRSSEYEQDLTSLGCSPLKPVSSLLPASSKDSFNDKLISTTSNTSNLTSESFDGPRLKHWCSDDKSDTDLIVVGRTSSTSSQVRARNSDTRVVSGPILESINSVKPSEYFREYHKPMHDELGDFLQFLDVHNDSHDGGVGESASDVTSIGESTISSSSSPLSISTNRAALALEGTGFSSSVEPCKYKFSKEIRNHIFENLLRHIRDIRKISNRDERTQAALDSLNVDKGALLERIRAKRLRLKKSTEGSTEVQQKEIEELKINEPEFPVDTNVQTKKHRKAVPCDEELQLRSGEKMILREEQIKLLETPTKELGAKCFKPPEEKKVTQLGSLLAEYADNEGEDPEKKRSSFVVGKLSESESKNDRNVENNSTSEKLEGRNHFQQSSESGISDIDESTQLEKIRAQLLLRLSSLRQRR